MATIVSFINPEERYNPFTGIPELERQRSGIPRAEVIFSKRNDDWAAAGAGNNRQLVASMSLDTASNFGYVLMDCFARFRDDGQIRMSAVASVNIYPGGDYFNGDVITTNLVSNPDRTNAQNATAIGSIEYKEYNTGFVDTGLGYAMNFKLAEPKPTGIIYPYESPGSSSLVEIVFGEEFQNAGALKYDFYCRFLQFDVSQSYNYVVNTPQLMR